MQQLKIGLAASVIASSLMSSVVAAEDDKKVAEDSVRQWNAAIQHRSLDDILALYSQDAMVLQPNGKLARGQEDIRAFWRTLLEKNAGVFAFDIVDVNEENPDVIVTTAKLSHSKALPNSGQFMRYNYEGFLYNVLRRQNDGTWKAQAQRWN